MSGYMEDTSFELPACLENGVQSIGDLWDCRDSVPLNLNLLSEELSDTYLRISPMNQKKTHLHHLKNTEDKLDKIDVNGEIKLELLAGLIKADASAGFKKVNSSNDFSETIALQYDLKTYSVELLPSAKNKLNEHAFKLIKDKKIKATHVVTKVLYGASIETTMTFTHKVNHDSRKISGISNFNPILKHMLYFKIKTGSLCGNLKKGTIDLSSNNFMLDFGKKNRNNSDSVELKIDTISKPY
jgi:hypothetical protein